MKLAENPELVLALNDLFVLLVDTSPGEAVGSPAYQYVSDVCAMVLSEVPDV